MSVQLFRAGLSARLKSGTVGHKWKGDQKQYTVRLTACLQSSFFTAWEVQTSLCHARHWADGSQWNIAAPMSSWQTPAHFLHMVMKLILTLDSSGVADVVDNEWQADNAMCWTGYSLGKRCHTWSFQTVHLSVSEHNMISLSGQMQISTEDPQKPSWGKCSLTVSRSSQESMYVTELVWSKAVLRINNTEAQQIIPGWIIVQIRCRYNIINNAAHFTNYISVQMWSRRLICLLKSRSDPCCTLVLLFCDQWPHCCTIINPFSTVPGLKIAFCNIQNLLSLNSNARIALPFKKPNGKVNTWMAFEHQKWTYLSTFPPMIAHVF